MSSRIRTTPESSRPVHTVRYGGIKAAIWRNVVDNGSASRAMYNVTLTRSYRDGDEWKESGSLGYDELLIAAKALDDCHTFIHDRILQERQEQREQQVPLHLHPGSKAGR